MSDNHDIIEATPFQRAAESRQRRTIIRPLPLLILAVFLLLALAALFMFLARAVKIIVTPEPDTFRITSGFYYKLGNRYLMLPGGFAFRASKQGYHLLEQDFQVSSQPDQDFSYSLTELPGILQISTSPDIAAEVFIDQKASGTTPLTIDEIEPGLHDISLRSERFLDYDTEIDIQGQREENQLTAELTPAWAIISVTSEPGAANILVDDQILGQTPASLEVLQGERLIMIQKPGFKTWQSNIEVAAGIDQELDRILLEKSDGKVSLRSNPAGASVTIDGRYQGQTPLSISLPPASGYQVMLTKAGFSPMTRALTVRPEEDVVLNNTLQPIVGTLRLQVEPDNATLFVDGKSLGEPNRRLELTTREHEIRVTAPGYADYVTRLTPLPDSIQQLVVRLQTEEEARVAAIPTEITTANGLILKLIIPDQLTMGAGRREPGRRSNEVQRDVLLTRAYYLSTTEITNKQFNAFMPAHDSGMLGRALLNEDDRPVVNVSWYDAARFCNWLSEQEGLTPAYENIAGVLQPIRSLNTGYRLPTEAEWAWAARFANGPSPSRFPWGNTMPPREVHANYADDSAISMVPYHIAGYNDSYRGPAPVASFAANAFGIHDLAGNVAEWLHDFYAITIPSGIEEDPTGPENGDYHVIRGSSYQHGRFSELRWTYRDYGADARPDVGIRVARYLD